MQCALRDVQCDHSAIGMADEVVGLAGQQHHAENALHVADFVCDAIFALRRGGIAVPSRSMEMTRSRARSSCSSARH